MEVTLFPIVTLASLLQPLNVLLPMDFMLLPIVIDFKAKVIGKLSSEVSPFPITSVSTFLQLTNAPLLTVVTLSGIVTSFAADEHVINVVLSLLKRIFPSSETE